MKTLVLFDIDGTLAYSGGRDSRAFAATYQLLYDYPFPTLDWTKFAHVTDTTIFGSAIRDHFGRAHRDSEVTFFQHFYLGRLRENRRLRPQLFREVPGACAIIHQLLNDPAYEVGIATGGWTFPARIKLNHIGIPANALNLSGADGKISREEILGEVIDRSRQQGQKFDRVVYVGDAIWDVQTTRNMQIDFVGIRYREDYGVLKRAGATQVLTNYADPNAFLEAVDQATPPLPIH